MSGRILFVEDDEKLGRSVVAQLGELGYDVRWLRDGATAYALEPRGFDLLILDLMLPGTFGLDVLKRWREGSEVPVLVLSAKQDAHVKVRALALGADDYLTKPFWPEELAARVAARLRRPVLARSERIEMGELVIDANARRVQVECADVELTKVEFDLLLALARRPGAAVARAWLVEHVLPKEHDGGERTLDVHVSRLRKKLGQAGARVATVWGVGYRLHPQVRA